MDFTHITVKIYVLKCKMADQNSRQDANIKGINKNNYLHTSFLSTILLQEPAKVE